MRLLTQFSKGGFTTRLVATKDMATRCAIIARKSKNKKSPAVTAGLFDFRKPDFEKRRYYAAAAGVNFATMPSSGLNVCLARSVYMPAIFCDSVTKAS